MTDSKVNPRRAALWVLVCALAVIAVSAGIQQSFGLFMLPISAELGWGREVLSLALAGQALIIGLATPFVAAIADRWGAPRVLAAGGVIYAVGLVAMSQSGTPTTMIVNAGFIIGIAAAATGMPLVLSVVGRAVSDEKRSVWLGTVTACGTLGQFIVVPFSQTMIGGYGWAVAIVGLAILAGMIVPLAYAIGHGTPADDGGRAPQKLGEAIVEARSNSGYLLLILGFFVCGFHVRFIAVHLPAWLSDLDFSPELAATALVVIAVCNGVGSWGFGWLGGRYRKKNLLAALYSARALVFVLLISIPASTTSVLLLSAAIGFLWLGTVPLTSGIVAQIFGTRYMATLYGFVFLSHQVGAFLGVWLGGRLYDTTGSYQTIWWISIGLGLAAAAVHLAIDDKPTARLRAAPAS